MFRINVESHVVNPKKDVGVYVGRYLHNYVYIEM